MDDSALKKLTESVHRDPLATAQSRVFAATCLLFGLATIGISVFAVCNHDVTPLVPSIGSLGGVLCLAAPLSRGRVPVRDDIFLVAFASITGTLLIWSMLSVDSLFSTPSLFLLIAVSAVTLVGGRRAGIVAVSLTIASYCLSYGLYHHALPLEANASGREIDWRIAVVSKIIAALFFFFSADAFRSGMTKAAVTLREAKDVADAANAMKSRFVANMSHEVRTPLNGILGMAQALKDQELSPVQCEQIAVINRSGELLLRVLDDVLDISKIEANKLEIEARPFDLIAAVDQVVSLHRSTAETKGLGLSLTYDQLLVPMRRGDEHRIMQIVGNVLSNCVKFTLEGRVDVCVEGSEKDIRVTIADTGIGMSGDQCAKIAEPFMQADSSVTRRFGGTGLGLSIVSRLIELMNGEFDVRSEEGVGSTFRIHLPLEAMPEEMRQPAGRSEKSRPIDLDLSGKTILIADDEPINRMVIETLLAQTNVSVAHANDGDEAVSLCAARDFDLVLMDISMPKMGGDVAMRQIRTATTGNVPLRICAVTGHAAPELIAGFLADGFDACLTKPVGVDGLRDLIERELGMVSQKHAPEAARPQARLRARVAQV